MEKSYSKAFADFKKLFEKLSYSQDYSTTFNSFLDFALWRLAPYCSQEMEEELRRIDRMYKESMAPVICEMFDNWSIASDNDGEGFRDVLGDLFMECVSHGKNGQFFTPQPVCDMMAQMTYGNQLQDGQTVCDPACGSGRTLMAMARLQRKLKFYGSDNDLTCVKMAVLNMMANSMKGEVAWMDTLSMEHYRSYHINLILVENYYVPVLTITGKNETNFIRHYKKAHEDMRDPVKQKVEVKKDKPILIKPKQLHFSFE